MSPNHRAKLCWNLSVRNCSLLDQASKSMVNIIIGIWCWNINYCKSCVESTDTYVQCESKKSPPAVCGFLWHFSQTLENFKSIFTHLLYVPIYARLQIFIQLSPNLTKLCHIKRDYLVHIICSNVHHRPERTRSDVCKSRWPLAVASHPRSAAFVMSTNMLDTTWRQQWRHLLSKQTYKLSSSEMWKNRWVVSLSMA